jgi:hypothetical protein
MATKKKTTTKKATTKKAVKPVLEISIQAFDGSPDPDPVRVDADGLKDPSQVYWKAEDPTKKYQIVLGTPPAPFKNGNGPFPTGANGKTITLTVDKKYKGTHEAYTVQALTARGKLHTHSGGGIIVDA